MPYKTIFITYDLHIVDHYSQVDIDKWIHQNHLPYMRHHSNKDYPHMDHLYSHISFLSVFLKTMRENLRVEQSNPEYPDGQIHWKLLPPRAWQVPPLRHGWLAQGSIPKKKNSWVTYPVYFCVHVRSSHRWPVYGFGQLHVNPPIPFGTHWPPLRQAFIAHGSPRQHSN